MTLTNRLDSLIQKIEEQQNTMIRLQKEFNDHTRAANRIQFETEKVRIACNENQRELEAIQRELDNVPTLAMQK